MKRNFNFEKRRREEAKRKKKEEKMKKRLANASGTPSETPSPESSAAD